MPNQVALTVYQINNKVLSAGAGNGPIRLSFPTTGVMIRDTSGSSTRSLPTGVNVYSAIQVPNQFPGQNLYYVTETISALVTAFG